jgi:hypothetical protein
MVPRAIRAVAIGVAALIFLLSIFRVIPAGQVGVKVLFGQVDPSPLREGLNVLWNPLLQAVHVEMVLNYRVVAERAPEVYRSIGLGYSSVIIDSGPRRSSRPTPRPTTPPRSS